MPDMFSPEERERIRLMAIQQAQALKRAGQV